MSPRRWLALLCAALVAAVLSVTTRSGAQPAPSLQVQTDVDTVGVGELLHFLLTAQSGEAMPADPQPGSTPGFMLRGRTASPTQTHININGQQMDRYGLSVDFTLQAQRTGVFTLGPATVVVGGSRFASRTVTVRVVPTGQAPQRLPQRQQQPFGFSPFDPWKGLLQGMEPPEIERPATPEVVADPKLALDQPRGGVYFLHATIDKPSVAVGEQVVFSVYEYIDVSTQGGIEVDDADVHDATAPDFVKRPLMRDDADAMLAGFGIAGGRTWQVKLVRRVALFPIHAGDLAIGPMSVTVVRPRAVAGKRTTEMLTVHVVEPPAAGRPPLYALGDVGRFTLGATVTPREVEQGGAVGVHVELSGSGNLPAALSTPARRGVQWLEPETHDQLGTTSRDVFGGKRTFDYVVRVLDPGDLDLGEISLPYWDPAEKRYGVARAALGVVHVKPLAGGSAMAAAAGAQTPRLEGLPAARDALEGRPEARAHLDDSKVYWLAGLGGWPLAFAVAVAGRGAWGRADRAWSARRTSPETDLRRKMAAADAACEGGDARAADAAVERALQAATLARAGVRVTGALASEMATRLEAAGVPAASAREVVELLRDCEAARFSPEAVDVAMARERWQRARTVIRVLSRSA